jgi:hypothetical protein
METAQQAPDVLVEAVEVAKSRLEAGEDLIPLLITDRWGDLGTERFAPDALADAKQRFAEWIESASNGETCALVHLGRDEDGEEAIRIERGGDGYGPPASYVQRFRPKRGPFRGFKLVGKPELVDPGQPAP